MTIKDQTYNNARVKLGKIYYDTLNFIKHGTTDMFFKFCIETATVCNRKCSYCPNYKFTRGNHKMKFSLFKKIIGDLKEINYDQWVIPSFYNESLLEKRLLKLLKYTKEQLPKSKVWIFSNGDFLDQKIFNKLDKYVDKYLITNHGKLNPNIPESNKMIIENLKYADTRGGLVDVGDKIIMPKKRCLIPTSTPQILYNGDMVLCCNDYFGKYVFGNVKEENIMKIWNKPNYKKTRKDLRNGIVKLPICKNCFLKG